MRPTRLSLEGFSAYRSRVEVDLESVEFFALSGPTGAGKSSLVDAMIFALYGRIPRLGARVVAPVITAGADRARVAFGFEVGGEGYVASRVAERTESGAAVREARLEKSDGTPIASGAGEVTAAVERLLRLKFEDFTKTVVLPQGEFARFLNAGSKERRDLLRDLLGLEIYGEMRELAGMRRSVASERVSSARSRLESLEVPGDGELEQARKRLSTLEALSAGIEERLGGLDAAERELESTREALASLDDAVQRLEAIAAPDHLEELEDRLAAAREVEDAADRAVSAKRDEIEALRGRLEELPGEERVTAIRAAHSELQAIITSIEGLGVEDTEKVAAAAERRVEEAEQRHSDAGDKLISARMTHAAHAIAASLEVGGPCPVCHQPVGELPVLTKPDELADVEEAAARADEALRAVRQDLESVRVELSTLVTRRSEMRARQKALSETLADAPGVEELERAEEERAVVSESLATARSELSQLEEGLRRARTDMEEAAESLRTVSRVLMIARERIADLRPPHSESDDPAVQWKDLLAWRDGRVVELGEERVRMAGQVEGLVHEATRLRDGLIADLTAAGVPAEEPFAVQVAREVEVARQQVDRFEELLEQADALGRQVAEAAGQEAVAGALAGHLKANGFERWLMAGAITGLVIGANELLSQLSGGGYSLEADEEGSLRIIDHRNADELREVATLSGGETFLVSLALSLSLAETLSGSGGAGLDAIILDEGFGTLDEESLDTVAAVLEELAGRGLMVGVITHVKELAARAPVRYQVTREPEGSRVEVLT